MDTRLACILLGAMLMNTCHAAELPRTPRFLSRLESGQPVTVVGFGDSITGVYYHTGGHYAWPEMLGVALRRLYPQAPVRVVNAGLSGNATDQAVARLDHDVLAVKPDLVVVMFGMNDVARIPAATYEANLTRIVERCRAGGAEVVLCTPNLILPGSTARSAEKLAEYAGLVRRIADQAQTPLVDFHALWQQQLDRDPLAFRLLMSDALHPNLRGHKVFAEEITRVLTGRVVSLQDVPPGPALGRTLGLLAAGKPVQVLAMAPADALIAPALQAVHPGAQVNVTVWATAGKSLPQLETDAKTVRERRPDLVVIVVPQSATASNIEDYLHAYTWVLNWSLSFGHQEWDCVVLTPSVFGEPAPTTASEALRQAVGEQVLAGQGLAWLRRGADDKREALPLVTEWLRGLAVTAGP